MTFDDILEQAIEMLQRRGRVTYRTLKRQFHLDDEALEDLKFELIDGQRLATDENGTVLVWTGVPDNAQDVASLTEQEQQSPQAEPLPTAPPPEAERRQLTVMFCDLVDSTKLSSQLDPEDYRDVVRAYQATCTEVIRHYDGHIAQLLGDGLLVYFGYPQAHEDDAHRAVRTGLEIIDAVGALNTRLGREKGITLAIRLGIHTGLVVVGAMGSEGRQEALALGEVPNVCARIQGLAEPNTIAVSAATYRLVQGYFDCDALGEQTLRGIVKLTSPPTQALLLVAYSPCEMTLDGESIQEQTHSMMTPSTTPLYKRHRFPAEIISHCVWLYFRFSLSYRDVQEMMAERGVIVSHEAVRYWGRKFGQAYANQLRRRRPRPGDKWHMDEAFLTINGVRYYLWRAVDQDDNVLDILVQSRRNKKAAKKFFKKLLKGLQYVPRVLITDQLKSYAAAKREVMPGVEHRQSRYLNNRCENSHRPTRERERRMQRFKSPGHAQRFLSAFGPIASHFRPRRHLLAAPAYRQEMRHRFQTWREITGTEKVA